MGAVTDSTTDTTIHQGTADGETGSLDAGHLHGERSPAGNPSESNGVHLPSKISVGTVTDPTAGAGTNQEFVADGVAGAGTNQEFVSGSAHAGQLHAKPAIEFSPAPPHIHRGASGGIYRGPSGGIHRGASGSVGVHRGASGGIHRGASGGLNRGASGGIYRGRSGGVHLPSLTSITFSMSRLPEEDAGLQMHLTETKEVESPPGSPRASDEDAPPRKKSRLRKHLTVVGACSFGFRLSETVLSLIAIVVMCSNSQSMSNAGADFGTLKFNHFQAYSYLVAVNVCVFLYSSIQFIQLAYTVILGISFIPSIFISTWLTFGFDQLFSYLLLSASTSAATVANMSYTGEMGVRLCSRFDLGTFCARADAAVTMSLFTFLAMLSSTILAIYRIGVLLKEY